MELSENYIRMDKDPDATNKIDFDGEKPRNSRPEKSKDDDKEESAGEVIFSFIERVSLPGIIFLFTSRSTFARVIWTFMLLLMLVALTIHLVYLVNIYTSWPKLTQVSLGIDTLQFPAVTFCNVNPARESMLHMASKEMQDLVAKTKPENLISAMAENARNKTEKAEDKKSREKRAESTEGENNADDKNKKSKGKGVGLATAYGQNKDAKDKGKKAGTEESDITIDRDDSTTEKPTGNIKKTDGNGKGSNSTKETGGNAKTSDYNSTTEKPTGNSKKTDGNGKGSNSTKEPSGNAKTSDPGKGGMAFINNLDIKATDERGKMKSKLDKKNNEVSFPEPSVSASIIQHFLYLFSKEDRGTRIRMGHHVEDMLVDCSFNGGRCLPRHFTLHPSTTFGNCFTVDHDFMTAGRSGPMYGLTLVVFLEEDEYLKGLTTGTGGHVVIHDKKTFPFPEEDGLAVAAGMEVNIALRMLRISRLGRPYGECNDGTDFFNTFGIAYTRRMCQHFCEQSMIIEHCGCYDNEEEEVLRTYNGTFSGSPCTSDEDIKCMMIIYEMCEMKTLTCLCDNPCSEIVYTKSISMRQWPSDQYVDVLVEALCLSRSAEDCERYRTEDKRTLIQNFIKINIYYEDLNYENVTEIASYEITQFSSDIGGALGLWLGLSVITVIEVGHFVATLGSLLVTSLWKL